MFQTRQEFLNQFCSRVNGRGRCRDPKESPNMCTYVKEGHPGCAIGCQPGFPAKSITFNANVTGIVDLINANDEVRDWIGEMDEGDERFLASLQSLHDKLANWQIDGKRLRWTAVRKFANMWGLDTPKRSR